MRFDRDVFKLAAGLGLAFWAVAALAGTIFLAKSLGAIYGLLLLFFPVRSMLAALQMKSYAEGRYSLLFLSGVVSLAGLAALRWAPLGAGARLAGLTLALALGAAIFIPGRHSPWRQPQGRGLRCLPDWLTETLEVKCPLAISALTLASDPAARQGRRTGAGWVQFQFARTLAARLGEQGAAAMSGPNRIVWFDTGRAKLRAGSRRRRLETDWVLANSAGWTESLRSTGFQPKGKSALQAALALGLFGPELDAAALSAEKPLTAVDVEAEFRKWAPGGIVFDPSRSEPAGLRALAPSERRGILLEALSFISGASPFPNRTPFHVTAFVQGGALRLIFLIDRRKPYALKAGWGSWLWRRNLEAALNGRAARPKGR
jgi:hypothetical protein